MSIKIYNSLTNQKEQFRPIKENEVSMYVCGPTVYDKPHIGNARPMLFFDMLKRYLVYSGYTVKYVNNITDIDDKIIQKAIERNISEKEVASENETIYLENLHALKCDTPDELPRATEYLGEMKELIQRLIDSGYAYLVDNDVYFRVTKIEDYGIVSNQVLADLRNSVRIENNERKENPLDFTLWKKTSQGISWDSPFGFGRPGWHTECVTMIKKIFNGTIDIHGGGSDLKFPHHENEVAQNTALEHSPLANYFMHVGRLDLAGEKMSKSLGNVRYITDYDSEDDVCAFRLLILMHYYRSHLEYSDVLFDEYRKNYEKIKKVLRSANAILILHNTTKTVIDDGYIADFRKWMDDDFNTPNVFSLVLQIVKEVNTSLRAEDYTRAAQLVLTLEEIMKTLGFDFPPVSLNLETRMLYISWLTARSDRNYREADRLRAELISKGVLQ